jgi:hypothetical protein
LWPSHAGDVHSGNADDADAASLPDLVDSMRKIGSQVPKVPRSELAF